MIEKKYIHIYQCKKGYILAEDMYDSCGILIAPRGKVLNEHEINRLKSFRVRQLMVYQTCDTEVPRQEESLLSKLKRVYQEHINTLKLVMEDFKAGKKLDYEKVEQISRALCEDAGCISSIIEHINELKGNNEYIYTHSINVSIYALLIAKWLGYKENELKDIVIAGILHDIGKLRIPGEILNKKGRLLPEEYKKIKEHVVISYRISRDIHDISDEIRLGILMHHERMDGKGYPLGITGDRINRYAKIIALADVYDAMTSEKVYKNRATPFDTFEELLGKCYDHFDTNILTTFLSNLSRHYMGTNVKMNNGETGKVVYIAPQSIAKPVVAVKGNYIDLSRNRDLRIVEIL